jgi:hypothetical protein
VTAATTPIPQPYLVDAVVDVDIPSRTLAVWLAELELGYGRRLWREAHEALVRSEQNSWRTGPPTLYASTPDARNVVHAMPGDFGMLLFRFPPGEASFAELIGKPRLVAKVAMDRSAGHFIGVTFKHRGDRI